MVKLTNREANGFISPVVSDLFNSKDRRFPVEDAFRLAELIQKIQQKMRVYQEQSKRIIELSGGKIQKDGRVDYDSLDQQMECSNKLEELNRIEIEIEGEKVKQKNTWPNLSIQEAFLLKPLIED